MISTRRREPRLAPLLDKLKAPASAADAGQLRQLQAETARLSTENTSEKEVYVLLDSHSTDFRGAMKGNVVISFNLQTGRDEPARSG